MRFTPNGPGLGFTAALMLVIACSAPPTPAATPLRITPPQPVRDANGAIITTPVVLPEGTAITAQTLDFVSSETANEGDRVNLEVAKNVVVDNAIAIPAGARLRGVVSSVRRASRLGKAGSVSIQVESTEAVDRSRIHLRSTKTKSTDDKVGSVVALTLFVTPLFLLMKGDDVAYQPGTMVIVYTDDAYRIVGWRQ